MEDTVRAPVFTGTVMLFQLIHFIYSVSCRKAVNDFTIHVVRMPEIHDDRMFPMIQSLFKNEKDIIVSGEVGAEIFDSMPRQFGAAVRIADNAPVGIEEILIGVQFCVKGRFAVVVQRVAAAGPDIERIRVAETVFF